MISRLFDWLRFHRAPTMTGIYFAGRVHPHLLHPTLVVGARVQRRLENTDRVTFVASVRADGTPEAKLVKVYRRPERRSRR